MIYTFFYLIFTSLKKNLRLGLVVSRDNLFLQLLNSIFRRRFSWILFLKSCIILIFLKNLNNSCTFNPFSTAGEKMSFQLSKNQTTALYWSQLFFFYFQHEGLFSGSHWGSRDEKNDTAKCTFDTKCQN